MRVFLWGKFTGIVFALEKVVDGSDADEAGYTDARVGVSVSGIILFRWQLTSFLQST